MISTAIKKGKAEQAWIEAATASMTTLNKKAAEVITARVGSDAFVRPAEQSEASSDRGRAALQGRVDAPKYGASAPAPKADFTVHAMTDITGFGLIGHAREILLASDVSMKIHASRIPLLAGALDCIHAGHIPGGLNNNRAFAECMVEYDADVPEDLRTMLYDPQTAGGLFICTPDGESLTRALNEAGIPAVEIGEVLPSSNPRITIAN